MPTCSRPRGASWARTTRRFTRGTANFARTGFGMTWGTSRRQPAFRRLTCLITFPSAPPSRDCPCFSIGFTVSVSYREKRCREKSGTRTSGDWTSYPTRATWLRSYTAIYTFGRQSRRTRHTTPFGAPGISSKTRSPRHPRTWAFQASSHPRRRQTTAWRRSARAAS